jgi:hypothetical protein
VAERSPNFGFLTEGHDAVFHQLALSAERALTGLEVTDVRESIKALADMGRVKVEGKARGSAYRWVG